MRAALALLLNCQTWGAAVPVQLQIERSFEGLEIRFPAFPGTVYRLDRSCDLATWTAGRTLVPWEDAVSVTVSGESAGNEFFRVLTLPVQPLPAMVWIEPGQFVMGSPSTEVGRFLDKEEPLTQVTLTRGFWLCWHEVTQEEFQQVMGSNPSSFKGDLQRPVENVTWFQAVEYCDRITERERDAGRLPKTYRYRLPTESEWEFAARAGTRTRFSYGDDPTYEQLGNYAWFAGNSGRRSHPVGQKRPNPWGLYDMHGNVFEWCLDWFGQLPGGSVTNYPGVEMATDRNIRGGYWDSGPAFCRCALRVHFIPETYLNYLGFRVALSEGDGP